MTDTPESLSQISAIAPVSDISNIQPSFVKTKSRMMADTTWENAVSQARGEPDGAEKSFHKKRSKVSLKVLSRLFFVISILASNPQVGCDI